MLGGVFRGGCAFRTDFRQAVADEWCHVATLLVVWLEGSQHIDCRLWTGSGLGAKMVTYTRVHTDVYSLGPLPPVSLFPQ